MNNILKKLWQNLWLIPFAVTAYCVLQRSVPDPDTFFLAATGRYIVENGIVPVVNPFVIHENFGIIVQQWLFDVMIYIVYGNLGNLGLFCFQGVIYALTMLMLYKYFGLFTENKTAKKVILIISGIIYMPFAVARPTLISFPVLLALLYCLEQYRKCNKLRYLFLLPVLSLLQINIHAAMWPMMFVMMMPYVFPFVRLQKRNIKTQAKKWFEANKNILLAMIAMVLAGFLNPNGTNGLLYVLKSYGSATGGLTIAELASPTLDSIWGIIILAIAVCFTVYAYKNKDNITDKDYDMREEFTRASMLLGVMILACMHKRNAWYLILGATPVILQVISNCSFKLRKQEKEITTWQWLRRNFISIVLIGFFSYIMFGLASYSVKTTVDNEMAPIAAADYLDEVKKTDPDREIILFTEFNNGAYMEWRGYQVYIDARPELFQSNINGQNDIYTEFCNVKKGNIDYEEFLEKYSFTHLIVPENTLFDMYLKLNSAYEVAVNGNGYALYQRK